jgi:hypothetical protein
MDKVETLSTLDPDIVKNIDSLERKIPTEKVVKKYS